MKTKPCLAAILVFAFGATIQLAGQTITQDLKKQLQDAGVNYVETAQKGITLSGYVDTSYTEQFPVSDVASYFISKRIEYCQSSTSAPTLNPLNPYIFSAVVQPSVFATLLTNSTATPPSGGNGTITFSREDDGELFFYQRFRLKPQMDAAFGNDTYNLTINSTTPTTYKSTLAFGDDHYPPTPVLKNTNWSGENSNGTGGVLLIDPTKPFTFTWQAFQGSAIDFFINNASTGQILPADGKHTSYVLPANTLAPNTTYVGGLIFKNYGATNITSIPGATGRSVFAREVHFIIQTGAVTPPSPIYSYLVKSAVFTQSSNAPPVPASATDYYPGPYHFYIQTPSPGQAIGIIRGRNAYLKPNITFNADVAPIGLYELNSGPLTYTRLNDIYDDASYFILPDSSPVSPEYYLHGDVYPAAAQVTQVNGLTPVWDAEGRLVLDPNRANVLSWPAINPSNPDYTFATGGLERFEIHQMNQDFRQLAGLGASTKNPFNSITIPASTLTDGNVYHGEIDYLLASGISQPSATEFHVGGYSTHTYFAIAALAPKYNLVFKQRVKLQTSNNIPVGATPKVDPNAPNNFQAQSPATPGSVGVPTPYAGTYTDYPLTYEAGDALYEYQSSPISIEHVFNSTYPEGGYRLSDGAKVNLIGDVYPNVPQLLLVNGATPVWNAGGQLVLKAGQANALTWTAFAKSNAKYAYTTGGYEEIQLVGNQDSVALKMTASGQGGNPALITYTIPANTLTVGNTYTFSINYFLASDLSLAFPQTNTYNGAGYSTKTDFIIAPAASTSGGG